MYSKYGKRNAHNFGNHFSIEYALLMIPRKWDTTKKAPPDGEAF